MILLIRLLKESLMMAWQSIISNRLRTLLSLSGIAIGIFSIITVFTVLNALENSVRNGIAILGSENLYVEKFPWTFDDNSPYWDYMARPQPSYREYLALQERMTTIRAAAYIAESRAQVAYQRQGKNRVLNQVNIWITTAEFLQIYQLEIAEGRFLTESEVRSGAPLSLIGASVAENIFERDSPIGKTLKMNGKKTTVIGVFAKEGDGLVSTGVDDCYVISYGFGKNIFDLKGNNIGATLAVRAKEGHSLREVREELRLVLRSERRIPPLGKDSFSLNQLSMIIQQLDQIFSMINLAGLLIGGIAILVGGFGVANIMFVSVKERTKIIGIQKAIGAKNWFVLFEFLCESVILCLIGGLIGLFLVYSGTLLLGTLAESGFVIELTPYNILRGILISAFAGVVSGFIPAKTASDLNPVEAMNTNF